MKYTPRPFCFKGNMGCLGLTIKSFIAMFLIVIFIENCKNSNRIDIILWFLTLFSFVIFVLFKTNSKEK